LTADITASGPTTAADIAQAIVTGRSALTFVAGTVAAFNAFQGADCQLHVADERTTAAALDELICRLGGWWKITPAGEVELGRMDFTAPAITFGAHELVSIAREKTVMPTRRRAVGYARNNRPHNEAEIATILLAADIEGLGDLAYLDNVDWALVTGAGRPDSGATRNVDGGGNQIRDPITMSDWAAVGDVLLQVTGGGGPIYDRWRARLGESTYVAFGPGNSAAIMERFPVVPGETMHAAWYGYREAGAGAGTYLLNAYDATGSYLTTLAVPDTTLGAEAGGQWVRRAGKIVIPAGWAFVWPHVGYNEGGTGYLYVGYPYWGRAAPGADITGENTALNTANVGAKTSAALLADSAAALNSISIIVSDGYLDRSEKPAVVREWLAIVNESSTYAARTAALGLAGHATYATYSAAYLALSAYLGGLSPAYDNLSLDTAIVGSTFRGKFTDYYYARQLLVDLFTATAKAAADAAQATANSKTRNVPRGNWDDIGIGVAVEVGDFVKRYGASWIATAAHTKTAINGPPLPPVTSNYLWTSMVDKGDDGDDGLTGQSTAKIFIRSVSKPSTPAPSASTPAGYYDDPDDVPAGAGPIWAHTGTMAVAATVFTWGGAVRDESVSIVGGQQVVQISGLGASGWIRLALGAGSSAFVTAQWRASWSGGASADLALEARELGGTIFGFGASDGPQPGAIGEPTLISAAGSIFNGTGAGRQYEVRAVASKTGAGNPTTVTSDSYVKA
jgi:hypothetical protein